VSAPSIAVLAPRDLRGEQAGADRFHADLVAALGRAGADAELVCVPVDADAPLDESFLLFYDLNLDRFDGVVSTRAPAHLVRHRRHCTFLLHLQRDYYDRFDQRFPAATAGDLARRRWVHLVDRAALSYPHTRRRFAIDDEVCRGQLSKLALDAEVLQPGRSLADRWEPVARRLLAAVLAEP
jgi:hypothetical protein